MRSVEINVDPQNLWATCLTRCMHEGPRHLELSSTEIHVFVLLREALKNRCWPAWEGELAHDGNPERQRRCCVDAYSADGRSGEWRRTSGLDFGQRKLENAPFSSNRTLLRLEITHDVRTSMLRADLIVKKVAGEVSLNSVHARSILQLVADPEFLAVSGSALLASWSNSKHGLLGWYAQDHTAGQ